MFKPFMRHRKSGVTRIVRDNYAGFATSFLTVSRSVALVEPKEVEPLSPQAVWRKISKAVIARDGHQCVRCPSTVGLEVHHIVPLSRGGLTVMSNMITLCRTCHDQRHSHLVVGNKSRAAKAFTTRKKSTR